MNRHDTSLATLMIGIDILLLPSLAYKERGRLPACAGIYFVFDDSGLLYIGQSRQMRQRWTHHTSRFFKTVQHRTHELRIRFFMMGHYPHWDTHELDLAELLFTLLHRPSFSGARIGKIPSALHCNLQELIREKAT